MESTGDVSKHISTCVRYENILSGPSYGLHGKDAPQARTLEPHLMAVIQRVMECFRSGAQFEGVGQWWGRVRVQLGF